MPVHVKQWVQQSTYKKYIISLNPVIGSFTGTSQSHYRNCLVVGLGPFLVVEKVSPIDHTIQFSLDGKKKTVLYDELQMDPCNQHRTYLVKDKLACHQTNI